MPRKIIAGLTDYNSSLILAIDCGAKGALAWIHPDGSLHHIEDMPIVEVRGKKRVSASGITQIMKQHVASLVVIEQAQAMPRKNKDAEGATDGTETKMGAASTGAFFYGAGILEGAATALGLPVEIIHPRTWKTRSGTPADKGAARQMAQRLFPEFAGLFKRKMDDGRADAALLGRWAALKASGE